jgi:hypothetical protein
MGALRVLVANEPRSYREAHAFAIRALRPSVEVVIGDACDDSGLELADHLVLCSTLTDAIRDRALGWLLVYPDEADLAVSCVSGRWRLIQRVSLDDVLAVVDEASDMLASRMVDFRIEPLVGSPEIFALDPDSSLPI